MTRQGIPLRPDRSFTHARALSTLVRSVIVAAAGKFNPATTSENFVREKWGAEEIREIPTVLRAASSPASPTQAGWAAELAQTSVALIAALQPPISAGAALLQRGLQIEFGRDAAIRLPAIAPGRVVSSPQARRFPSNGSPPAGQQCRRANWPASSN